VKRRCVSGVAGSRTGCVAGAEGLSPLAGGFDDVGGASASTRGCAAAGAEVRELDSAAGAGSVCCGCGASGRFFVCDCPAANVEK